MERRYRWHAVETLRSARRSHEQSALAGARQALESAQRAVELAERALQAHDERALVHRDAGAAASALELQRAAAFAHEHARVALQLRSRLQQLRTERDSRLARLEHAQSALADSRANHRVIERDRERASRLLRQLRDGREQAEIEERSLKRSQR